MNWWERYGLFVPGVWTTLDDIIVFMLFMLGVVFFVIYSLYYEVMPDMVVFSVFGILMWVMLLIYILGINKK